MLERFLIRLYIEFDYLKELTVSILRSKRASAKLPKHIMDELARCFLPDILAFYETVEGREEYEEWKLAQAQQTPQNAPQSP